LRNTLKTEREGEGKREKPNNLYVLAERSKASKKGKDQEKKRGIGR